MKVLDIITPPVYIDVYEESIKELMNNLTEDQLKLVESSSVDFGKVKSIIEQYKKEYNINVTHHDIGKSFCPVSFNSLIAVPVMQIKNTGNCILTNVDNDGTCYFQNGTSHFKFPDTQETGNSYYDRVICADETHASQMLVVIKLKFPSTWNLKGV
jgi:hypothetical protein